MNTITKLLLSALTAVALAFGATACGSPQATSPGQGSYDTAPLNVPLRNGSSNYSERIVDDAVTSFGRFEVVWQVVNVGGRGSTVAGCSGQHKASDIHMLVYSNGSQVRNEASIESTCSLDPGYSGVLQPGQSLSFFAQFATPPALGNQIAIRELSYGTSKFNPYGSYNARLKVTPNIPQWMLPVVGCVRSLIPGRKVEGINAAVDAGTLPFGLSDAMKEFGDKPPPYTLAGFYEAFRQLPVNKFGACMPTATQIQQWLSSNRGALGPGTPGPPALAVSSTGNPLAQSPCQRKAAGAAVVGPVCFIIPHGYYQSLREPDLLTASTSSFNGSVYILAGKSYDDAFAGRNVGNPSQQLGLMFSGQPLNMDSAQSISGCNGQLTTSSGQPFGPDAAEYREWTVKCPGASQQNLQVWRDLGSKVIVASVQDSALGSASIQAMVTHASFINPTAGVLLPPTQISPQDGSVLSNYPRTTTFSWSAVSGAGNYLVQIQACNPAGCEAGIGQPNLPPYCQTTSGTSYSFNFVGAQPGHWRVAALKPDGELGLFSPWWGFAYTH